MQRAAVTDAARYVGQRSVLHFPSHGKAVLRGGFLSIQASGFLLLPHPFGKVLSVSFFMRVSAFCCAGLCVLLHGSFVFSCASLCPLLRGSELSLVRFSAFFCVNQWRGRCGLSQWKWRGDGTVELGAAGRGFPVGGFGEIDRCFEKRSAAGWIDPTAALALRRDRDSNPGYSHPYAAFRVRSIRPLWHLSSSGSAALPVPCARGWWWRPWSNPFRSAKLLQPFHSNKHWSEKASSGQGVFIFRADGLCSLSRGFLLFCQKS